MMENGELYYLILKNMKEKDKGSIKVCLSNCQSPLRPSRYFETFPEVEKFFRDEKKLTMQDARSVIQALIDNGFGLDKIDRASQKYKLYLELYIASYWCILKPIFLSVKREKHNRARKLTFVYEDRTFTVSYQPNLNSIQKRKDEDKTRAMANPKIFQTMESQEANVFVKNVCTVSNSQNQEENEFISSPCCLTDYFTTFDENDDF